jgi:hypothetical protein
MNARRCMLSLVGLLMVLLALVFTSACSVLRRGQVATATPTKTPVVAGAAAATPTSTRVPPSPTPERSYNECPLTGVKMADPTLAMRRPLDIKVDNYPGSRPPSGLHKADVVFEHFAEGAITRFSAIFLCQDAELVGPVRSARLIDVEHLADMFDAVLVHYGAANRVLPMIREAEFPDMDGYFGAKGFTTIPGRVSPFNKYCETAALWEEVEEQGWQRPADRQGFSFTENVDWDDEAVEIEVRYAPQTRAHWSYDEDEGLYVRYAGDELHVEETTGEPLTAANVIVLEAEHIQTDIDEGYGSFSVRIELLGEGPAMVFRDGKLAEGTWVRTRQTEMIQILGEADEALPLKPGNVWVQVVPDLDIIDVGSLP